MDHLDAFLEIVCRFPAALSEESMASEMSLVLGVAFPWADQKEGVLKFCYLSHLMHKYSPVRMKQYLINSDSPL
jgi:hypothetical protein